MSLPADPEVVLHQLVLNAHEALDEGVVIGDGEKVLHVNAAACRLYGRGAGELLAAKSLFQFLVRAEQDRIRALVAECMERGDPVPKRFETVLTWPDGTEVHVEMSTTAVLREGTVRTLTLIRDIGERRRHQAELEHLALHDALTGLPNRRLLIERLNRIAARAEREAVHAGVFFLDLNGFKAINDAHGHDAGDRVLVGVAHALRDGLRACDNIARLGGDEFVVVCEQVADKAAARRLAVRLAEIVARPVELPDGTEISMGVSVGIHRFGDAPIDPEEVLRDADAAMYQAKSDARARREGALRPVFSPAGSRSRRR